MSIEPETPWRLLVVDDDPYIRDWLRESLELLGFDIETAEDGHLALTTFEAFQPDLILMDAMMPGMDGFEACRAIKQRPDGNNIPIIQMTGVRDDEETVQKSFDAGCQDFITKPINITVVHRRIESILLRVQAEKLLQQAHRDSLAEVTEQLKITSSILEKAAEAVLITDDGGKIQSVNPAFTAITGYSQSEAIGQKPSLIRSDRHEPAFYKALWASLESTGSWGGEIWNRRKNGEVFPVTQNITAIRDNQGEITHFVSVFSDLTLCKSSQDHASQQSANDPLTGLPDRYLFDEQVKQAAHRANRSEGKIAILLLGIDAFRRVNDSLGYAKGDEALKEVADRLRGSLKEGDLVSRLRGDEFGVVVVEVESIQDVILTIQKIFRALNAPFVIKGHEIALTTSVGAVIYPDDSQEVEALIQRADKAMSLAKERGGASFQFFTPALDSQATRRLALESDLRKALKNDEFSLHYQPKIDFQSGKTVGTEALIRWNRPEKGLTPPNEFIPLAEESGLIIPMGKWILDTACRDAREWAVDGACPLQVSVNLSSRQFQDPNLTPILEESLAVSGLPPACLEVEITESLVMGNVDEALSILKRFKAMGLRISMDDFGTGYSSLSYLKHFPIDTLKIDQSFVRDLTIDSNDAAIAKAIIAMGKNLGLTVVAEGVETREQADFLAEEGCDLGQGYLFSKPLEKEGFTAFFKNHNQ